MQANEKGKYFDEYQGMLSTKFPNGHFLANQQNVEHALLWNTFLRRNLNRCATDYLGLKLHFYQAVLLYFMGICYMIVVVACRAAAKSFIIAVYACCRCITRPYTKIVIASSTKKQAKLIVVEKIQKELMQWSPMLCREIRYIRDNANDTEVIFWNGSSIIVTVANDNARGYRSNVLIREEFRMVKKRFDDSVLSPMQFVRPTKFSLRPEYANNKDILEQPVDIYISSSWYDSGHWMWDLVDQVSKDMLDGLPSILLAFDESVVLKYHIKTKEQLRQEKKKQDQLTWKLEFLNERIKDNSSAFFSYSLMSKNQKLRNVSYPALYQDFVSRKQKTVPPKQVGEIRIISCDLAFVENSINDNSIYTYLRLLESATDANVSCYKRQLSYMESKQGGDIQKQALRIRQLFEDFDADYIVLDTRNAGRDAHLYGNI